MDFITELAKVLGIDPDALQGVGGTTAAGIILYIARGWFLSKRTDNTQVSFEQKLVDMTADATEENRKLREAYENNTAAIKTTCEVLTSLVAAVRTDIPAKLADHETAIVAVFNEKTTEMKEIVKRRDDERIEDVKKRDENHNDLKAQLALLVKEVMDATDEKTLRSAVNRIELELAKLEKPQE